MTTPTPSVCLITCPVCGSEGATSNEATINKELFRLRRMNIPQLNEGEYLAGLCMVDCEPSHWLILLPVAPDKNLTWQAAMDWAKSVGGELPTRFESALIFANLRDKVDLDNWHWTATPYAGAERYAWLQHFGYGSQSNYHKGLASRAVAVRRVPV